MSLRLKRNHSLTFDPNQFKTQEMCEKAIDEDWRMLSNVSTSDRYNSQEMCEIVVEKKSILVEICSWSV